MARHALAGLPRISAATPGDVYYNRTTGFRRRYAGRWEATTSATIFNSQNLEFLGEFNTEREATDHAIGDGNYAIIEVSNVPTLQRISGYTAAAPAGYVYYWTKVNPPPPPPIDVPGTQDYLLRWSDSAQRWQSTELVTGASIDGIGTSADPLVVDVHDVVEDLNENIHWTTPGTGHTDKGATVCNIFNTGPNTYVVTHTKWNINVLPDNTNHYRARIYRLVTNSNEIAGELGETSEREITSFSTGHDFRFSSAGVMVPGNTRVAVCLSRTRAGGSAGTSVSVGPEDSFSPVGSYDDADADWDRVGWTEYDNEDPQVGRGTRTHDTDGNADDYGELRIYYRRIIDHGSLLAADHVDLDHLADDVTGRLLPGTVTDDQIARYDSASRPLG